MANNNMHQSNRDSVLSQQKSILQEEIDLNIILPEVAYSFIDIISNSISQTPMQCNHRLEKGNSAEITMNFNKKTCLATLIFNDEFLKIMCKEFLFDENPDTSTMNDMAKEIANLVIGHTKVLAQAKNIFFTISTPTFLGIQHTDYTKSYLCFQLNQHGYCNIFIAPT
ncbi:chemotaxis protein CheX [Helicobacter didelphidarum]|uniref:Chemotaxis protein CheX n=1 Tax=Helicobacter didelphidarum TaxID=2040648 RepID=A0A3D8INF7_9HELI|nr:chemotaxis protein CheX [Helicobacter didelphidarum]RDU66798.1 chemotaxis protein CheX [Helicobacter didelphidarum]